MDAEKIKKAIGLSPSDGKKQKILLAALCAAGILLVLLPQISGSGNSKKSGEKEVSKISSAEEYSAALEKSLQKTVSEITGDKNSRVLVTLQSGFEYVYASEEKSNTDSAEDKSSSDTLKKEQSDKAEKSYIILKNESGDEEPLVVTEIMPEVKGIVVVCDGGNNENINLAVKNAVVTALKISESKVYVTGRGSG